MKFCKNLQRVVDISDPEWAPYWPNYKMLKKLIKELPSLVPVEETKQARQTASDGERAGSNSRSQSPCSMDDSSSLRQQHGDKTAEKTKKEQQRQEIERRAAIPLSQQNINAIRKGPGEVAFFKLLHSELKKAVRFFDRATEEFIIREGRVSEGMNIMKQPNSIMVNEKWTLMGKGIYRLYRDLLLLETFAIMAYCSFSKILKKHDKVTGYNTRIAFMTNIVNKANFTHYPKVLEMITRCESLYESVSENLHREGKEGLYEDERLFISMIHRLNEQVLETEDSKIHAERKESPRRLVSRISPVGKESQACSKLRTIVEESEISNISVQVKDLGQDQRSSDDSDDAISLVKRPAESGDLGSQVKRQRGA